ncbi:autoinducer 2 ABC transporter substrate-binding protein [Metabacillus rhizolycopersici]|uniref:Autoinducer 2 ABC transporter substrate-binding protein n=1 Tax=Metabacillus rhizolycopersici TaxID=2875709 RepID=A0ABS7UW74_9BACI|nr:autoinducer 2 ABC transporter substrate-binding protein [Metabacillus rhizolycopersici]MBZ5752570.1 autoinducer 2 ABC transporter substrate-binding protein [Metabacillus rhizolycopersici]
MKCFLFPLILIILCGCSVLGNKSTEYEVVYKGEVHKQKAIETKKSHKDEPYTIGIVPKIEGIPYFNAVKEGALEAGKDLGVNIIYKGPSSASWKEQAQIIDEFIERNVDGIAVAANDPLKLGSVLQKARNRGIEVITWDSDTNPEFRSFFVNMVNSEILGRHLMDALATEINENGKYVILTGSSTAANLNDWIKWMEQQNVEYYPNMELVEVIPTNEDPHIAYMTAQKILDKYPDLKGIIGVSTVNPPVAAQVVKDKGKIGDIKVIGVSSPLLMKPFLQEGVAQMITLWSPQKLGYLTVSLATNLLNDESPYNGQQIRNIGVIEYDGDMVIMGQPIDITKENVDQYDF